MGTRNDRSWFPRTAALALAFAGTLLEAGAAFAQQPGSDAQPTVVTQTTTVVHAPSSARRGSHRRHRRQRVNLRAYRANVASWHNAGALPAPTRTEDGRLVLRLWSINTHARAELTPARADGGFDEAAGEQFARVLADSRTHSTHAIDGRLMDVVYQIASHFDARQVSVISGFRAGSGHSNHGVGRAIDILIPGVSDRAVSDYARTLTNVGVGIYPVSGFVHVDVRDYNTYWVDSSRPGSSGRRHRHARRHRRHHHRRSATRD